MRQLALTSRELLRVARPHPFAPTRPVLSTKAAGPDEGKKSFEDFQRALFDAGAIESDEPVIDLEDFDVPVVKGGGVLLRIVAFTLAAWCHALAPLGGRWGAAASSSGVSGVSLFATPLQWFGVAFIMSALMSGAFARVMKQRRFFQPIRAEGPASHATSKTKTKTPTAGGVAFVPIGCLVALFFTRLGDPSTNAVVATTLLFLGIGLKDDVGKLMGKANDAGLRPLVKFALQWTVALLFVYFIALLNIAGVSPISTTVTFGFGVFGALFEQLITGTVNGLHAVKTLYLPLGNLFYLLSAFAIVAESNAVNVTDGVDGLASSTCAIAFVALGVVCVANGSAELGAFAIAMGGASCGFLAVNRHPAAIFMGDSGSLALGGALGATAAAAGGFATFPLFVITLVFVVEVVSVIAQVGWFKFTKKRSGEGKRLLRMAPLHHHLELGGWGEVKVVATMCAFGALAALVGVAVAGGRISIQQVRYSS